MTLELPFVYDEATCTWYHERERPAFHVSDFFNVENRDLVTLHFSTIRPADIAAEHLIRLRVAPNVMLVDDYPPDDFVSDGFLELIDCLGLVNHVLWSWCVNVASGEPVAKTCPFNPWRENPRQPEESDDGA